MSSSSCNLSDHDHLTQSKKKLRSSSTKPRHPRFYLKSTSSSLQKERKVKKESKVFGKAPNTLIKKFGNIAKRFVVNYSSKTNSEESANETRLKKFAKARAPYPSAMKRKDKAESSSESNYVLSKIVSEADDTSNHESIENDSHSNFSKMSSNEVSHMSQQIKKESQSPNEIGSVNQLLHDHLHDAPDPAGISLGSYNSKPVDNCSSYSSNNLSDSVSKILSHESEATYSESESSFTSYEYTDETSSSGAVYAKRPIRKRRSWSHSSRIDSPEISSVKTYATSSSQQLNSQTLSSHNVALGNRTLRNRKVIRCESLQSIHSVASSFLDRKYKSLTFASKPPQPMIRPKKIVSLYATTQTICPTSSKNVQTEDCINTNRHNHPQLVSHEPSEKQQKKKEPNKLIKNSSVKTLWKISNESLKELLDEHLSDCHKLHTTPAVTADIQRNTRKLAPQARSTLPEPKMVQESKINNVSTQTRVLCDFEKVSNLNFSTSKQISVPQISTLPIDSHGRERIEQFCIEAKTVDKLGINFENTSTDVKSKKSSETCIERKDKQPSDEVIATAHTGIKKLINELNNEMKGVRELVGTPKCKFKTTGATVKTNVDIPQVSQGLESDFSSEQLTLMLNGLQSSLLSFVSEIACNNQQVQSNVLDQTTKDSCSFFESQNPDDDVFFRNSCGISRNYGLLKGYTRRDSRKRKRFNKSSKKTSSVISCKSSQKFSTKSKKQNKLSVVNLNLSCTPSSSTCLEVFKKSQSIIEPTDGVQISNCKVDCVSPNSHISSPNENCCESNDASYAVKAKCVKKRKNKNSVKLLRKMKTINGFEDESTNCPHPSCQPKPIKNSSLVSVDSLSSAEIQATNSTQQSELSQTVKEQTAAIWCSNSETANTGHSSSNASSDESSVRPKFSLSESKLKSGHKSLCTKLLYRKNEKNSHSGHKTNFTSSRHRQPTNFASKGKLCKHGLTKSVTFEDEIKAQNLFRFDNQNLAKVNIGK